MATMEWWAVVVAYVSTYLNRRREASQGSAEFNIWHNNSVQNNCWFQTCKTEMKLLAGQRLVMLVVIAAAVYSGTNLLKPVLIFLSIS